MTDHDKVHLLRMRFVTNEVCNAAADEIEQLREQLENMTERYNVRKELADHLGQQLAAAQAREQQLRENVRVVCGPVMDAFTDGQRWNDYQEIIDKQADTTALEAIVAKAGEVMRERCDIKASTMERDYPITGKLYESNVSAAIRALPGVTLEDLE